MNGLHGGSSTHGLGFLTGWGGLRPVLPRYTGRASEEWLLLPGWAQTGAYWVPSARWLSSAGIALSCPDLGTMAVSCSAPCGSLERTVQIVDGLTELIRKRRITALVAHSAGAPLAVLLAGRIPGLRAIALVEPVAGHFGIGRAGGHARSAGPVGPVGGDTAVTRVEDRLRLLYPVAAVSTLGAIAASMAGESVESVPLDAARLPGVGDAARQVAAATALAHLPVPALVVRGEASTLLSETEAEELLAAAPDGIGRLLIRRAGHSPHVDRPRETAAALRTLAEPTGLPGHAGIERRDER